MFNPDLRKNSMNSLALLDKIEENVDSRFLAFEKSNRSLAEFSEKIN